MSIHAGPPSPAALAGIQCTAAAILLLLVSAAANRWGHAASRPAATPAMERPAPPPGTHQTDGCEALQPLPSEAHDTSKGGPFSSSNGRGSGDGLRDDLMEAAEQGAPLLGRESSGRRADGLAVLSRRASLETAAPGLIVALYVISYRPHCTDYMLCALSPASSDMYPSGPTKQGAPTCTS